MRSGKQLLIVLLIVPLLGCATRTVITSQPRGALVSIDDIPKGYTPYLHKERRRFLGMGDTKVTLSAEDYQDAVAYLSQGFNLTKGGTSLVLGILSYAVGGYGIGLIFLPWDFTLDPHYDFVLQQKRRLRGRKPARTTAPPRVVPK